MRARTNAGLLEKNRAELSAMISRLDKNDAGVVELAWSRMGIDDAMASRLAAALGKNTVLAHLNLCGNEIGEQGGLDIFTALRTNAGSRLKTLDMSHNGRTLCSPRAVEGLISLLRANTRLASLSLSGAALSRATMGALATALADNRTLKTLKIAGLCACERHVACAVDGLARMLADVVLRNSTLTRLDIADCAIPAEGMRLIAEALGRNESTSLTTLDFRNNRAGSEGAQALAAAIFAPDREDTSSAVCSLDLQRNGIGDAGARALVEHLSDNSDLVTLDLSHNPLSPLGVRAVAQALAGNMFLQTLDLSGIAIGHTGARALGAALSSATSSSSSSLNTLSLARCSIGNDEMRLLARGLESNSTLTSLDLSANMIGNIGARYMAKALENYESELATLDLSKNNISNAGAEAIAEAMTINAVPRLSVLNLSGNKISDDGAAAFARALEDTDVILTSLNLANCSIGDEGSTAIANALATNRTLVALNLERNCMGDAGPAAIRQAMKGNKTLKSLAMTGSDITREAGATAMSVAMANVYKNENEHLKKQVGSGSRWEGGGTQG